MTKSLRKAIVLRSRLKNNFNKKRSYENWDNFKKQRNFCVKLLRQTKVKYFSDINVKSICDNKKFWTTIKPFFSNKGPKYEQYDACRKQRSSMRGIRNNSEHHE